MADVSVIICAAGASQRFGGDKKKPFVEIAGRAVFLRSIEFFSNRSDVYQIILAIAPQDKDYVELKWGPMLGFHRVKICLGGSERYETVAKALAMVDQQAQLVAIHDAVRCCLKEEWIDAVFEKARHTGAAILACPVNSTLKKVQDGKIVQTINRTGLYEAQTPQVFRAELIKKAYAQLKTTDDQQITDDAQLVERLGVAIGIVETDASNIKITRPADVTIAEAIFKSRPKPKPKGPIGPYDEAVW